MPTLWPSRRLSQVLWGRTSRFVVEDVADTRAYYRGGRKREGESWGGEGKERVARLTPHPGPLQLRAARLTPQPPLQLRIASQCYVERGGRIPIPPLHVAP